MRFEIRYFFLEIEGLNRISRKKVSNFEPHNILLLSKGLHAPVYSACAIIQCVKQYVRVCVTVHQSVCNSTKYILMLIHIDLC